jgi:hypothetical protein
MENAEAPPHRSVHAHVPGGDGVVRPGERTVASFCAAVLTGICLGNVCSCHEILRAQRPGSARELTSWSRARLPGNVSSSLCRLPSLSTQRDTGRCCMGPGRLRSSPQTRRPAPNGCLIETPCPPCTSHGASISLVDSSRVAVTYRRYRWGQYGQWVITLDKCKQVAITYYEEHPRPHWEVKVRRPCATRHRLRFTYIAPVLVEKLRVENAEAPPWVVRFGGLRGSSHKPMHVCVCVSAKVGTSQHDLRRQAGQLYLIDHGEPFPRFPRVCWGRRASGVACTLAQ